MSKTVIITGASGDIGREIARAYFKEGYKVAAVYNKSEESALALKDELSKTDNSRIEIFKCDLLSENEIINLISAVKKRFGKIDSLVNNAGISKIQLFDTVSLFDWNEMIGVNLTSPFVLSRECVKEMLREKEGNIINISSMWGQVGASCEVAYSASKGGLIAMTKALAKEVGLSGIRANCICPGLIDTKMNSHLTKEELDGVIEEIPLGVIGTPADVAEACIYLENAKFVTGQVLGVNGGMVI